MAVDVLIMFESDNDYNNDNDNILFDHISQVNNIIYNIPSKYLIN